MSLMISRIDLQSGDVELISLDDALGKLVPAYYMDREVAEQALTDGLPLRTTAFEYRRADRVQGRTGGIPSR